ncbi:MAG: NAD-dependent epimerase/dehydratase family protein [Burkholderiaceae bacterium]|nr:NAD-dependent epimerase/dehydratase family protein [Burkholderiaceae bacterium]
MKRIAITGAAGLLGWHAFCALTAQGSATPIRISRATFEDAQALAEALRGCDAVLHCAGVNRADPDVVETANPRIAQKLVDALERTGTRAHIVYTNSTQAGTDTPYGRSKQQAAQILEHWCSQHQVPFTNLIVPNVFGEGGKPFYNSVVSTFCHQLARGEQPSVLVDRELSLVHALDVAEAMLAALDPVAPGTKGFEGTTLRVSDLLAKLRDLSSTYARGELPMVAAPFDRALFNTYRSYLYPDMYPTSLTPRTDQRGRLVEVVRAHGGGQTFVSSTRPGITRGNHYHLRKIERFVVLQGQATIRLRKLGDEHVQTFDVSGEAPVVVDIPTLHTHNITNTGDTELTTLFWTNEFFDPARPDTFPMIV